VRLLARASVRRAWSRSAVLKSVPRRSARRRSDRRKTAPRALALRRFASRRSASVKSASRRSVSASRAPRRSASAQRARWRIAVLRSAGARSAHPRLHGEGLPNQDSIPSTPGSPPPAQEGPSADAGRAGVPRLTPACAGRTNAWRSRPRAPVSRCCNSCSIEPA
jgi:hypothetical protein